MVRLTPCSDKWQSFDTQTYKFNGAKVKLRTSPRFCHPFDKNFPLQSDSVQSDSEVLKGVDYSTHHQALNTQNDKITSCSAATTKTVPGSLPLAWQTTIGLLKKSIGIPDPQPEVWMFIRNSIHGNEMQRTMRCIKECFGLRTNMLT